MENLYRKIRPRTFEEVLGNTANIEQLQKYVKEQNRPHAYLFTGGSGLGKTTLARIFANELGADELTIKELNAADTRGIDTVRDIIEKMRYKPVNGKPLVYIVDEFHKFTNEAMNALLKPLEDTPDHVYFLLCSTNPEKIIKTIKTRSTLITVDNPDDRELFRYLVQINKQENLNVEKPALKAIMENCDNSIRQAIVMLEQISKIEDEEKQLKLAKNWIAEENQEVIELCRWLLKTDWNKCSEVLKSIKKQGLEAESIRYAVLGYMSSVLLNSGNPVAAQVMECFDENTFDTKINGIILASYQACYYE